VLKKWFIRVFIVFIIVISIIATFLFTQKNIIQNKAISGINSKLNAKVSVNGKIDITFLRTFPNITLELNNVFIEDNFNSKDTLANVAKVNFSINPFSVLNETLNIKSIVLQNGQLNLKTYKDGKSNFDIIKKTSSNNKDANLNLEEIIFENIDLVYDDLKSKVFLSTYVYNANFSGKFYQKDFDLVIQLNSIARELTISDIHFLSNNKLNANFDLFYKAENKCISFKENDINIDGNNFSFLGKICSSTNTIDLKAKANGKKLENALKLIPKDLFKLEGISGNGKYEIQLSITEKFNKPKIVLNFELNKATATIQKYDINITDLYTTGTFTNLPKSNLLIKDFAFVSNKTHLKGNVLIPNLNEKRMELKLNGEIYTDLFNKFKLEKIAFSSGKINLQEIALNFNYRKQDSIWLATKFQGKLALENIVGHFNDINEDFSVAGNIKLAQKKLHVKEFIFNIGKNDIQFSGFLNNALNYFQDNLFHSNDELIVNGNLKSHLFDINDFLKEDKVSLEKPKEIDLLKWLNIKANIDLEIDELRYKKLKLKDLNTVIKSNKAGIFSLKKLTANGVDGKAKGNIELRFFNDKTLEVFINAKLNKLNINKLFYALDNFGQKAITQKNLKGNLNADLIVSMEFENFTKFKKKDLLIQTNFQLNNGELIRLKSLESLSKYLSVEQLEHIYFETYKSSLSIVNELITLNNNEIKSNLISLDIGGTHSFKNQINYSLKLNLKNLLASKFKKKKTLSNGYVNDEKGGIDIFISMKGDANHPEIQMDRESAYDKLQKDLKQEKQNLKDIFKKDTKFFEEKNEFYFEDDEEEFIDFESE